MFANSLVQHARPIMVLWFILLIFLIFILRAITQAYYSPLRSIPGPFLAKFTRFWYLSKVWSGGFEKVNSQLHQEYGPLVCIAPNECSVDDPESLKTIYGPGTAFIKAPWYYASGSPKVHEHDIFTDRDPKRHADLRRKLSALYSMTSLLRVENYASECSDILLARFNGFAYSGTIVDLQLWMQFFAFDVIAMITSGDRFGFMENGSDQQGLLDALHAYLIYCANVGIYSEAHPYISKIMSLLPASGIGYLRKFVQVQINKYLTDDIGEKSAGERQCFLSKLVEMRKAAPQTYTNEVLFTACITNIGAGSDTTSLSLTAILYYLNTSPEKLRILRREIDEKTSQGKLSKTVTFSDAQSLSYLQACIKEGLRMHPATGLPLARVVPQGGVTIAGRFIGEGAIVGTHSWIANYNKDVFGADAGLYRPERWLEAPERISAMERSYLTFGAGSRTCIGKNISLMEISKVIPMLVRDFDFTFVDLEKTGLQTENNWFVKQKNLTCRISRR